MQDANNQNSKDYLNELKENLNFLSSDKLKQAVANMDEYARQLNNTFGQSRQRISAAMVALTDAEPRIVRLGGSILKTYETMEDISKALQRNVLMNEEIVAGVYATSKVLGEDAETLTKSFSDAGYQASLIGPQMSEAVVNVQNLGLNTKQVMGVVLSNMSDLNKFNFQNGVQGMTKMAAQAAMVKFNMADALEFANRVQDPEGAINMAAGLQRLGAAVGALADPFAMMNASINDPGALQDSLINMTKQFSYFDEKTKTFKISPQGILTMKEIAKETGISYDNLAKSAIGAQELDKRLSQIKPSIKFGSEEDKQYIANLGAMNAEGEYTIKMDSGIEKKLTDLTQQEFDDLIKQQKEAPKTVEDIARMQLKSSDAAKAALESINKAYYNGVVSARFVRENIDAINKGATITTGALSQNVSTERFRTTFENIFDTARERISKVVQDPSKIGEVIKQSLDDLKKGSGNISKDLLGEAKGIIENLEKSKGQVGKDSFIGQQFDNFIKKLGDIEAIQKAPTVGGKTGTKVEPIVSSILFGNQQQALQNYVLSENKTEIKESKTTVDFTGDVTFKVVAPPGMSAQQFETYIASDEFKKLVYNHWLSKSKELERVR